MLAAPARYTPPGLAFDEPLHRYTYNGRALVSVTGALRAANLIDRAFYTDEGRTRGSLVAAAIELWHVEPTRYADTDWPAAIGPTCAPIILSFARAGSASTRPRSACAIRRSAAPARSTSADNCRARRWRST